MNGGLPERIDPLHLADHHVRLAGHLPVAHLRRLCEALCSTGGEISISAEFGHDESRQRVVHLVVVAPVQFTCQRCMQPMAMQMSVDETLGIVSNEAEAERLGSRYEPLLVGADAQGRASLLEIVEDELLLRVPMIPRHEADAACRPGPDPDEGRARRESPFAVLKALKGGD
jgi:uncharacterized protein